MLGALGRRADRRGADGGGEFPDADGAGAHRRPAAGAAADRAGADRGAVRPARRGAGGAALGARDGAGEEGLCGGLAGAGAAVAAGSARCISRSRQGLGADLRERLQPIRSADATHRRCRSASDRKPRPGSSAARAGGDRRRRCDGRRDAVLAVSRRRPRSRIGSNPPAAPDPGGRARASALQHRLAPQHRHAAAADRRADAVRRRAARWCAAGWAGPSRRPGRCPRRRSRRRDRCSRKPASGVAALPVAASSQVPDSGENIRARSPAPSRAVEVERQLAAERGRRRDRAAEGRQVGRGGGHGLGRHLQQQARVAAIGGDGRRVPGGDDAVRARSRRRRRRGPPASPTPMASGCGAAMVAPVTAPAASRSSRTSTSPAISSKRSSAVHARGRPARSRCRHWGGRRRASPRCGGRCGRGRCWPGRPAAGRRWSRTGSARPPAPASRHPRCPAHRGRPRAGCRRTAGR